MKNNTSQVSSSEQPLVRLDRMMESLCYAEYDITSGIAEIVDNAVEAGAQHVWINAPTEQKKFSGNSRSLEVLKEIAVVDDGEGMDKTTLHKCLALGESLRPTKPNGSRGIGRFGVGLTLGGISLARRIEVFTRKVKTEQFLHTYIDLDDIENGNQMAIPEPTFKQPPQDYLEKVKNSTGTIVLLTKCDRLRYDLVQDKGIRATEQKKDIPYFLGRTYRMFIAGGLKIKFDEKDVYLHDPLYLLEPTIFDAKNPKQPDLKATSAGTEEIELDIPNSPGKKAKVRIKMTLLPQEWRKRSGDGGRPHAKERKIPENEGFSILRANREVLYGPVPYIIGSKGQSRLLNIDRWWGCEISFPPELDDYFHVRHIKRGAEPIVGLRDKINSIITPVVETLRKRISSEFEKTASNQAKEEGVYRGAEDTMAEADKTSPRGKRGTAVTPKEVDQKLDDIIDEAIEDAEGTDLETEKRQKKQELAERPYSIVEVKYPATCLFEIEHLLGKTIVKLNTKHPFYTEVFKPLCGSIESMTEQSDVDQGADTPEQRIAREGFMLLLLSYAKAESFFENHDEIFENLRSHWGTSLGTALRHSSRK